MTQPPLTAGQIMIRLGGDINELFIPLSRIQSIQNEAEEDLEKYNLEHNYAKDFDCGKGSFHCSNCRHEYEDDTIWVRAKIATCKEAKGETK